MVGHFLFDFRAGHGADSFGKLRAAGRFDNLQGCQASGSHTAQNHLDTAVLLSALGGRVVSNRIIGSAAFDLDLFQFDVQCFRYVHGGRGRARLREHVVVCEFVVVRGIDSGAVAVSDRTNLNVPDTAPALD